MSIDGKAQNNIFTNARLKKTQKKTIHKWKFIMHFFLGLFEMKEKQTEFGLNHH